jgi:hypothetical protein
MVLDPGWAARPPEANDLLLKGGAGVGPTLAALAGYLAEIASCEATAGVSVANMMALNVDFQGAASLASTAQSTLVNSVTHLFTGWLAEKPPLITAAVDAFSLAYSTMVPAVLCTTNREEWGIATTLNSIFPPFFMPDIIRTDTQYYGHFWPTNAGTGAMYAGVLTSLMPALAVPPPITPPGASPAAPAAAASAVAESTATGAAGDAMRASSEAAAQTANSGGMGTESVSKFAQQALQPLQQGLEALPKAFEGVVGLPTKLAEPAMSAFQSLTGLFGSGLKGSEVTGATDALRTGPSGAVNAGGLGPTAGIGGGGGGASGLSPTAHGLTSYTRPVSSFAPDGGGRPTGLRSAGLLSAAETRIPTTASGMGGGAMPMAPAGMLGHGRGENEQQSVSRARIVVRGDRSEDQ